MKDNLKKWVKLRAGKKYVAEGIQEPLSEKSEADPFLKEMGEIFKPVPAM